MKSIARVRARGEARRRSRRSRPGSSRRARSSARRRSAARARAASAPAIITRCSIPPESSSRIAREHPLAVGDADVGEQLESRSRAAARPSPPWTRRPSVRWSPIVQSGSMCARGSWKIIATRRARTLRGGPVGESVGRSTPSSSDLAPVTRATAGSSRRIVRAVIDFPLPDSPTRPTTSPRSIVEARRRRRPATSPASSAARVVTARGARGAASSSLPAAARPTARRRGR